MGLWDTITGVAKDVGGIFSGGDDDDDRPVGQEDQAAFKQQQANTQGMIGHDQSLAGAAANRAAYQTDYGQYNGAMMQSQQARGSQQDALGMMRQAALGNVPSAAQIQGNQMINQSLQAQMAGAASARGGSLAQAAAMHNAANGAAAFQQQGIGQLSALRAQETSNALGAYAGQTNALRGADFQGAGINLQQNAQDLQNQQFQRELNDKTQFGYDQTAAQLQADQLQGQNQANQINSSNWQHQTDLDTHHVDRSVGLGSAIAGLGGSTLAAGLGASGGGGGGGGSGGGGGDSITSDERAKRDAYQLGHEHGSQERPPLADPQMNEMLDARAAQPVAAYTQGPAPFLQNYMSDRPQGVPEPPPPTQSPSTRSGLPSSPSTRSGLRPSMGEAIGNAFASFGRNGAMWSDERLKLGIAPLSPMSGPSPRSGPANATGDYVIKGGGMDVMGTLKNMSNVETQTRMPTMQQRGLILSDEDAKRQAYILGREHEAKGHDTPYLVEPPRPGESLEAFDVKRRSPGTPDVEDMTHQERNDHRSTMGPVGALGDAVSEGFRGGYEEVGRDMAPVGIAARPVQVLGGTVVAGGFALDQYGRQARRVVDRALAGPVVLTDPVPPIPEPVVPPMRTLPQPVINMPVQGDIDLPPGVTATGGVTFAHPNAHRFKSDERAKREARTLLNAGPQRNGSKEISRAASSTVALTPHMGTTILSDANSKATIQHLQTQLEEGERRAYLTGRAHGETNSPKYFYGGIPEAQERTQLEVDPWQGNVRPLYFGGKPRPAQTEYAAPPYVTHPPMDFDALRDPPRTDEGTLPSRSPESRTPRPLNLTGSKAATGYELGSTPAPKGAPPIQPVRPKANPASTKRYLVEPDDDRPILSDENSKNIERELRINRMNGEMRAYAEGIAQARKSPGKEPSFYGLDPLKTEIRPSDNDPWEGPIPQYLHEQDVKHVVDSAGLFKDVPPTWLQGYMDREKNESPVGGTNVWQRASRVRPRPASDPPDSLAPGTADYMKVMGGTPMLDGSGRGSDFDSPPGSVIRSDERSKRETRSASDPMGAALDAMQPYAYRYKPGFGENPNAQQVGPMAQPMARDPVAATAIVQDPRSGLLGIDMKNATKLALGGLGYLKDRQDQTDRSIAAIAARMGPRRG